MPKNVVVVCSRRQLFCSYFVFNDPPLLRQEMRNIKRQQRIQPVPPRKQTIVYRSEAGFGFFCGGSLCGTQVSMSEGVSLADTCVFARTPTVVLFIP